MTQVLFVSPGQSNVIASGPQYGVKYTLTAPDGARCVFNDPEDTDFVGWLTDLTGLDSPDLREAADDLVGDDGGVHGDFFYGRRPIVISGQIESRPDNISRNVRMTTLQRASNVTRTDAVLRWAPEGGVEQTISVRRQQPLRITGGYNKQFQLALVAADPRIYSAAVNEAIIAPNTHSDLINHGTMRTPPSVTLFGPATAIEVHNHATGAFVVFATGFTVSAGQTLTIDFRNRTVFLNGTTNKYDQVTFGTTTWWEMAPGVSNIGWHATGTTGASSMAIQWQDAWV
jgi:hypothetical protein